MTSVPEKKTKSSTDTIEFTPEEAQSWTLPPWQRPQVTNEKVRELATKIGNDSGVIPGYLTFGVLGGKRFLVDGQHRRAAFLMSGKPLGYADVREIKFDSMPEMAQEYVDLNSSLVKMKPDDILRALETSLPCLSNIRKACPFVGYNPRRNNPEKGPILSMSVVIRCWKLGGRDTPSGGGGGSAVQLAHELIEPETNNLIGFLTAAYEAWGRDQEYQRLWASLNLTLCMWLFKRTVLEQHSARSVKMPLAQFKNSIMALSNDEDYLEWLVSRPFSDRSRAPCYLRITKIIGKRLQSGTGKAVQFPRPVWSLGKPGNHRQ